MILTQQFEYQKHYIFVSATRRKFWLGGAKWGIWYQDGQGSNAQDAMFKFKSEGFKGNYSSTPLPFPHFPERLYRRGLWSNQTFGWELKTSCIKNSEYESQARKYMIRIARFSLLVPYPNKFLVLCICILIFHGIYSPFPLPTNIFFEGECFFRVL